MSDISALLKNRAIDISDGIYYERAEENEGAFETMLAALVSKVPPLKPQRPRLRKFVSQVNSLEASVQEMEPDKLVDILSELGIKLRSEGLKDELLAIAFAVIREASSRVLGLRHHDVQLMGGWAMLQGMIAEMETGEGKTLVATLTACAAAVAGAAVHVITVNDYLAERDAEYNRPLFDFFGFTVGVIKQGMTPHERREQYANDITYVSNKEVVFDYLKDRIAIGGVSAAQFRLRKLYHHRAGADVLLKGLHVAIVDEADSVLVDEARTPLIISETEPDELGSELYHKALELARELEKGKHFEINADNNVWITPEGEGYLEELASDLSGVWTSSLWRSELIEKALSALLCFHRDQQYIVADDKVQIVDEFTGRTMPDRSWERGLHQMIEAKEGCEITGQRKTLSRITYQRFFSRYLLLCGMTGTAAEIKYELRRVYNMRVLKIPTHRPGRRKRLPDRVWQDSDMRWNMVAKRAAELSRAGRAVLVGTRSVEASEVLSERLQQLDVEHCVLNARQDRQEADVVADAGQVGRITVSTNMAGRGTDIRPAEDVSAAGGLHVILTEFHESSRIDRQLFGRCARQGEPGSVEAYICLQDELFRSYAPGLQRVILAFSSRFRILPASLVSLLVRYAQARAERKNSKIRLATLKQDRKMQRLLAFSGKET